jgi:uncharacterized protein
MINLKNRKPGWRKKAKRTITSILPIDKKRKGRCINCGECCKLPNICAFLKYHKNGKSYCSIHKMRPLNCRKYPRTTDEHVTSKKCGYRFE